MKTQDNYKLFISSKEHQNNQRGFKPCWIPEFLFDFQKELTAWAVRKGQAALFEDCGLGKTPQQLVWAENVRRKTNGNVLILTPLSVSSQTIEEGNKFDIECYRTRKGKVKKGINVTNYERLSYYNPNDFSGVVCDESSILKNFDGKRRKQITEFAKKIQYRLLCTATPAPNDYMELGTSAEALSEMTQSQMLGTFFTHDGGSTSNWIIKAHAKKRFWQWLSTWARAIRKPSDLNYDDDGFRLPDIKIKKHILESDEDEGCLIPIAAKTMGDQRKEKRDTIKERCEKVKQLIPKNDFCVIWCHLNDEGDYLEKIIPKSVQVRGSNNDKIKEKQLNEFRNKKFKVLITKPRIACFGLNWQHCSNMITFPSHSHEQFYQTIRRCWRFGQKRKVYCHIVYTQKELLVTENLLKKERQADQMYQGIIREMSEFQNKNKITTQTRKKKMKVPTWLCQNN